MPAARSFVTSLGSRWTTALVVFTSSSSDALNVNPFPLRTEFAPTETASRPAIV